MLRSRLALFTISVWLTNPCLSRASENVDIDTAACSFLDIKEVERIVTLELRHARVAAGWTARVGCEGKKVFIMSTGAIEPRRLDLALTAAVAQPRLVALAVVEHLAVAARVSSVPPVAATVATPTPAARGTHAAATAHAQAFATPPVVSAPMQFFAAGIGQVGGVQLFGVRLGAERSVSPWLRLQVAGTFLQGFGRISAGRVEVRQGAGDLALLAWQRFDSISFGVGPGMRVGGARLAAESSPDLQGRTLAALMAAPFVTAMMRWSFTASWHLQVQAEAGRYLRGLIGEHGSDQQLALANFFMGAALGISATF